MSLKADKIVITNVDITPKEPDETPVVKTDIGVVPMAEGQGEQNGLYENYVNNTPDVPPEGKKGSTTDKVVYTCAGVAALGVLHVICLPAGLIADAIIAGTAFASCDRAKAKSESVAGAELHIEQPTVPPTAPPTEPPTVPPTEPPTEPPVIQPEIDDSACDMFVEILGTDNDNNDNWQGQDNITGSLHVTDEYSLYDIAVNMSTIPVPNNPYLELNTQMNGKFTTPTNTSVNIPINYAMAKVYLAPGQIYDGSQATYGVMLEHPYHDTKSFYVPNNDKSAIYVMDYDDDDMLINKPGTPKSLAEQGYEPIKEKDIVIPPDLPEGCNLFLRREENGNLFIYARVEGGDFYRKSAKLEMLNKDQLE